MIATFLYTLRFSCRSSRGRHRTVERAPAHPSHFPQTGPARVATRALASQSGETLIEVLVSAILVALIVVALFDGFDVTNRASASERARAQADALAQQAEDKLRGAPIATLTELEAKPLVEEVTQNGTKFTITSTAQYVSDATATASCNSSATSASYLRTSSSVTWGSLGARQPVVESSIISPPPGSALIVQVTNAASEGVAGMTVTAAGPAPASTEHTLTTGSSGCAILALLPGEYSINVSQTGYVDENWALSSKEDVHSTHSVYLTAENATKLPYRFDHPGTLEVKFSESVPKEGGDSFVAFNSGMTAPSFKAVGMLGTYEETVKSSTRVFPFSGGYAVYAGTCEANNPQTVNPKNGAPPPIKVNGGKTTVTNVTQPPINIRVMSGTGPGKATEGVKLENATGTLEEPAEPDGCGVTRKFTTTKEGALPHPGMPFGEYTLCVTGGASGPAAKKKYTTTFENDTATGPSRLTTMTNGGQKEESGKKFAVIYMNAASGAPGQLTTGETCP